MGGLGIFIRSLLLWSIVGILPAKAQIKRLSDLAPGTFVSQSQGGASSPAKLRPQKRLPESLLQHLIQPYLEEEGLSESQVTFDRGSLEATLPYEAPSDLHVLSCTFSRNQRRLTVGITSQDVPQQITLHATVEALVTLPALAHGISPDHLLTAEDLHFVKVPARKVPSQAVLKIEDMIGARVKPSAARPHQVLKHSDLSRPRLVKRGQTVSVHVIHHKLQINMPAQALEHGEEGQRIRLINTQTNRTLHATIVGPGQAEVALTPPLILAKGETP